MGNTTIRNGFLPEGLSSSSYHIGGRCTNLVKLLLYYCSIEVRGPTLGQNHPAITSVLALKNGIQLRAFGFHLFTAEAENVIFAPSSSGEGMKTFYLFEKNVQKITFIGEESAPMWPYGGAA